MKISWCHAVNFGSYKEIEFDFENLGLSLIYGPTGSGKSTLCDIACWALYGVTAKNGNVDEVRSWLYPTAPTHVSLQVETSSGSIMVQRVRGKSSENDLFWIENEIDYRGKDINETQKLLETRIGVTAKQFLSGAYFSEFSSVGGFFKANSKQRRSILEEVANLELPIRIATAAQEAKKNSKSKESVLRQKVEFLKAQISTAKTNETINKLRAGKWDSEHKRKLEELEEKSNSFIQEEEANRLKLAQKATLWAQSHLTSVKSIHDELAALGNPELTYNTLKNSYSTVISSLSSPEKCNECGQVVANKELYDLKSSLEQDMAEAKQALKDMQRLTQSGLLLQQQQNPYLDTLEDPENVFYPMLIKAKKEINPLLEIIDASVKERLSAESELVTVSVDHESEKNRLAASDQLYDLSFELRGILLKGAVSEIESKTNYYLDTYFESEIKISLTIEGSDKLETLIHKSGHECVYTQLSKGQRGLLRLCFSIAVMEISANKAGQHFDCLMFDEALDGLDAELKVKAHSLFQELATRHSSILLIEHSSEFQNLFENKYAVSLRGDESSIEHE